ncbi:MAG: DUF4097 family beta strand repeat-containing protein [Candidatus Sulfotelmatobacter sp.]
MSRGKIDRKMMRAVITGATLVTVTAATLVAETHKEFHFNVGPKAGISVNNPYGSISVRPATGNVVTVNAVYSDKVQIENNLVGNRVELQSRLMEGADAQSGKVEYDILVPADASVTLHSSNGVLRAEKLRGDVTLEGADATVDVRDISAAHVHVKTLNGPVKLTNVQDGHVEVDSLSGTVTLTSVVGPLVQVISTSGEIVYVGDFGDRGLYRLTSHSGDIDVTVPETTSADVNAQTIRGEVHDDIHLQPTQRSSFVTREGNALLGSIGRAAVSSTVIMRSFSGKIHLRKRSAK